MGFCSAVTLAFATIFSLVAAALLAIAFSTDNWITITVDRDLLKVSSDWPGVEVREKSRPSLLRHNKLYCLGLALTLDLMRFTGVFVNKKWKKLSTKSRKLLNFNNTLRVLKYCLKFGISLNSVLVLSFKCGISTLANIQIVQMFAEFVSKMGIYSAKFWRLMVARTMCFMLEEGGFGCDNNILDSWASITLSNMHSQNPVSRLIINVQV